jgi:ribulose-5-phosphate 4-epimerase/fuculose-1-phosphate aldolase
MPRRNILKSATLSRPRSTRVSQVAFVGEPKSSFLQWFAGGLERELLNNGHSRQAEGFEPDLVINFTSSRRPRPYRRRAQGTFVVTVVEVDEPPEDVLRSAYPYLVRSLANLLIYIIHSKEKTQTHFVTMEQGYYTVAPPPGQEDQYFAEVYRRLAPLASSTLVINNLFEPDLEPELWNGDEITTALYEAGRKLDELNLLPAPFPIDEILGERDLAHVKRLYGIGGLSYGNLSARKDATRFWMSASGVDKSNLREIGRDLLLITDYLPQRNAMRVSIPPHVEPRRASVDAIEHWRLYMEHPEIGAIIHIHAWMEGIVSTTVNYPCGTYELANEVAELVSSAEHPSRAVIGLKNHGLTVTGHSLEEIFDRISDKILPQVPME